MILKRDKTACAAHDRQRRESSNADEECFRTQRAEKSELLLSRKERLDSALRKSFELLNTLRTSADQVAALKPIHRAALRLQSLERPSDEEQHEHSKTVDHRQPMQLATIAERTMNYN